MKDYLPPGTFTPTVIGKQLSPGVTPIIGGTLTVPPVNAGAPNQEIGIASGPKQIQRLTINVPAGGTIPIMVAGDFCLIETVVITAAVTFNPFTVRPNTSSAIAISQQYTHAVFPTPFSFLEIFNPATNTAITVTLTIGFGRYQLEDRPLRLQPFGAFHERTRPNNAVAYAANQIVGEAGAGRFEFAGVYRPGSGRSTLRRARITKNSTTTAAANFKLFLVQSGSQISTSTVDQAVFDQLYAGIANNNAVIQFPVFVAGGAGSDCAECIVDGLEIELSTNKFAGGDALWGYLVALAAYAPAANEKFRIELWGDQH